MNIRHVQVDDYLPIVSVMNDWWGGRQVSHMLPRLFFEHFRNTSFVIEQDGKNLRQEVPIVAFLIGFLSQSQPDEAYIHFVGVHPDYRKQRLGKTLYELFFKPCSRATARSSVASPPRSTPARSPTIPAWASRSSRRKSKKTAFRMTPTTTA